MEPPAKAQNYIFMTTRQIISYLTYVPIAVLFAIWCSMVASCGIIPKEQPHPTKREIKREKRLAKKAIAKMERTDEKYKAKSEADTAGPHFCNTNYPPRIGKGTVIYKEGKPIILPGRIDTVERVIDCDTAKGKVQVRIPCPPCDTVIIHDTLQITDTLVDANEANLWRKRCEGMTIEIEKKNDEIEGLKKWRVHAFIGYGLLALLIAVIVYANVKGRRK